MTCPVCGFHDKIKSDGTGKPRSIDQHKRFFKVCSVAYENWPEKHVFQPATSEHLRYWLTCAAGKDWRDFDRVDIPQSLGVVDAALFACEFSTYVGVKRKRIPFPRIDLERRVCTVYTARSLKFDEMPHLEFCALSNAVDEVIKAEMGIDPEALLKSEAA